MSVANWPERFRRFFEPAEEEAASTTEALEEAERVLAFARLPFYEEFLDGLTREADKPSPIGDHMAMIAHAARANTYREIREGLRRRVSLAVALVSRIREEHARGT